MEQLKLSHIAPYLPYGLKVEHERKIHPRSKFVVELSLSLLDSCIKFTQKHTIKPLLHPLSDLYKEIDGKVGIVDLAKISADFKWKLGRFYCDGEYIDVAECRYGVFLYNKSNRVFELCNIYGLCGVAPNQLDLFTYLFQHHYDVFSLIDKGLAIDLNSISHE